MAFLVRGGRKIVFKPDESLPNLPAPVRMPSDFTFVNRLQWGFASVLAGLEAEANWRRLVEPWLHGPVARSPEMRSRVRIASLPAAAPRVRARPGASYGDPSSADAVVHAENLDAMRRLAGAGFAGRFRCVYLDPPFNSGRRFAEYDDALDPGAWRAMMRRAPRGRARRSWRTTAPSSSRSTTPSSGRCSARWTTSSAASQRVSTITIVRSAATGHKADNRGPVNVTDYLLVYAKDRARWRCNPRRPRAHPLRRGVLHLAREPAATPARRGASRPLAGTCAARARAGRRARRGRTRTPSSTRSTSCASRSLATRP